MFLHHSTQTAKNDIAYQKTLFDILGRIENFFRRLEKYSEMPTTEEMKDNIVKIMAELLIIFGLVTEEMKQGWASE